MRRFGHLLAVRLKRWIPDSFVFALGLTVVVGALAATLTDSSAGAVLDAWYRGFWILLEFGMQIVLVLVTGYAIALSEPATRVVDWLAERVTTPAQVYAAA